MASRLNVEVGTILNTKDVPQQLKELNAQLKKTESIRINVKVGDQLVKAVKVVRTLSDEYGNLYKHVQLFNRATGQQMFLGSDKGDHIQKISEKIRTLTTEVHKWTDSKGAVQTWTTEIDSAGNRVTTRVKEMVTDIGEITTETSRWGQKTVEINGQLRNVYGQLGDTIREVKEFTTEMTTTTTSSMGTITDTVNGVTNSYRGLITTTEEVGSNGEYLKTVVSKYVNELGQAVVKTEQFDKANNKVATTERVVSNAISNTSAQVKGLGSSFSNAITTLTRYYLASLPIRAVQTAISETITTLKDFDNALIEFRKVSDLAGESLTNYVAKLAKMGEATGSTMTAMVEASTQFRKSGFSDEDSAILASLAEKFRNVADEEISAADSASFIIAQMKAFNIEAQDAEHILDAVFISNI